MTHEPSPWLDPVHAAGTPPPDTTPSTRYIAPSGGAVPPLDTAPKDEARPARGGGVRIVLGAAILSAVLASGATAAMLLATRPATPATAAASPSASAPVASTVVTRGDGTDAVAAVAAATEPSVVTISGPNGRFGATSGSGIVVSADGLILTTAIVAPTDTTYDVLLADEHQASATVVARDAARGLVLLRAAATSLAPARLGTGAALVVGQLVVAVGSPLGEFTDTVTSGIVSGLERSIDLRDPSSGVRVTLDGLIQTDAAINAGSSGGPLLDASGTVVGIIATSASDGQGIGFAIPIAAALELIARAEA